MDPLDYEDFLIQHSTQLNRDSLKHILDFPPNDVQVKYIPKKIRTVEYVVPKEELAVLPQHVQQCVDCYTRPWKVVEFAQRHNSSSCNLKDRFDKRAASPSICQQEFEIDKDFSSNDENLIYQSESCTPSSRQSIASLSSVSTCTDTLTPHGSWASFDLRSSINDPLISGLLDRVPIENVDQANEIKRSEDRQQAMFNLYPDSDHEEAVERRIPAEIPIEHIGNRILVKCLQLK